MRFELFRRGIIRRRQWYWRLRAANGRVIAVSGEGYCNRKDAIAGIDLVMNAQAADIREVG